MSHRHLQKKAAPFSAWSCSSRRSALIRRPSICLSPAYIAASAATCSSKPRGGGYHRAAACLLLGSGFGCFFLCRVGCGLLFLISLLTSSLRSQTFFSALSALLLRYRCSSRCPFAYLPWPSWPWPSTPGPGRGSGLFFEGGMWHRFRTYMSCGM